MRAGGQNFATPVARRRGEISHREFIVWQLADEVRREVIAITDAEPVTRDWSFRKQIRDACDSACANFAEGFGRYKHKQFAHFVRIVRGSLKEVIDQLDSALQKQYITRTRRAVCSACASAPSPQPQG
ncbi:MAG: four helix bundle protein [Vicinamibacterales bacterium]